MKVQKYVRRPTFSVVNTEWTVTLSMDGTEFCTGKVIARSKESSLRIFLGNIWKDLPAKLRTGWTVESLVEYLQDDLN